MGDFSSLFLFCYVLKRKSGKRNFNNWFVRFFLAFHIGEAFCRFIHYPFGKDEKPL